MKTKTKSPHPVGSSAWLGDDNIENTLMRIKETADCSWTELCIKTVQEIARPLQEEIEKCKVDRNRIGMTERRKYLPEIERLNAIIKRASVRFFEDGTSDGETAAAMLRILDEAKSPNIQALAPPAPDVTSEDGQPGGCPAAPCSACDGTGEVPSMDATPMEPTRSCSLCDGTGDAHDMQGEWRGECPFCEPNAKVQSAERQLKRLMVMLKDARKHLSEWEGMAFDGDPRRRKSDVGCMATRDLIRRIDEDSATWPNTAISESRAE